MTRLQQREFWMASQGESSRLRNRGEVYENVTLSAQLEAFLIAQISAPPRVKSGLLFGYSRDQTLHILLASTSGISNWYPSQAGAFPEIDLRFALGWSEAVLAILGSSIDWVGHWSVPPDLEMRTGVEALQTLLKTAGGGQEFSHGIRLITGFNDGVLSHFVARVGQSKPLALQVSQHTLEDHLPYLRRRS